MDMFLRFVAVLVINALLFVGAMYKRIFDIGGLISAFAVGFAIGWFGDVSWLVMLLLFMFTGFLATKYKFAVKEQMGVQEGHVGERGYANVLATGIVPASIAFLTWNLAETSSMPVIGMELGAILFLSAISVAASDTLASELGVLSSRAYLITTLKPVKAGANGGVSWWGEMWAIIAAAYVAIVGYLVLLFISGVQPFPMSLVWVPLVAGFLGCQIDSLLGATIEGKYFFGKHSVNLVSITLGTVIAWLLVL